MNLKGRIPHLWNTILEISYSRFETSFSFVFSYSSSCIRITAVYESRPVVADLEPPSVIAVGSAILLSVFSLFLLHWLINLSILLSMWKDLFKALSSSEYQISIISYGSEFNILQWLVTKNSK